MHFSVCSIRKFGSQNTGYDSFLILMHVEKRRLQFAIRVYIVAHKSEPRLQKEPLSTDSRLRLFVVVGRGSRIVGLEGLGLFRVSGVPFWLLTTTTWQLTQP